MRKDDITRAGAVALCRAFDKKRGKKNNEDTIRGRAWELIRLVAIQNGFGAKENKQDRGASVTGIDVFATPFDLQTR